MNKLEGQQGFLDELTNGFSTLLTHGMEQIFGPEVTRPVLGPLSWADLAAPAVLILLAIAAHSFAALVVRRKREAPSASDTKKETKRHLFHALSSPLYSVIWVVGAYLALAPILEKLLSAQDWNIAHGFLSKLVDVGIFAVLFWLFFRLTRVIDARLAAAAAKTGSKMDVVFAPLVGKCLRIVVPVIAIILGVPILKLPAEYAGLVSKGSSILLIVGVAMVLFEAVALGEHALLAKFDTTAADNLRARKVRTQAQVISKTLYILIGLFAVASILMLFQEVRHLGTSILASAGVVGVILGFAAQKTIANLFYGLQVALAQPIRLDDVVIVGESWGHIEEITLTYVVVHVWDDTRLIVPLSDFIEKQFQNWTRKSAGLLGSVILYVDYSLPISKLREVVGSIVESDPKWDKRFWNLQVSDATEHTMQIRVLCTAANSSIAWDLRCNVREKLIDYIQKNYPDSLPRYRGDWAGNKSLAGSRTSQVELKPPPE